MRRPLNDRNPESPQGEAEAEASPEIGRRPVGPFRQVDWRAPVNFPIEPDEWKALTPDEFERVKASTTLDLTPDEWDRLREVREGRLMRPGSFKSICYVKSPVPTDGVEEAAEAELKFRRRCDRSRVWPMVRIWDIYNCKPASRQVLWWLSEQRFDSFRCLYRYRLVDEYRSHVSAAGGHDASIDRLTQLL